MTDDYITTIPRTEQEDRRKIRTFTGRYINPLAVRAAEIDIRDIAHHLSNICRYTGACPGFYSVAQHSVLVSRLIARDVPPGKGFTDFVMAGLLHDAGEYLFNDLASPVKRDPRMAWYREAEHQTTRLVFAKFGLDPADLELTKPWDDKAFHMEAATWWGGNVSVLDAIVPLTPKDAETWFLSEFASIQQRRYTT